jgi:hypothetical protein
VGPASSCPFLDAEIRTGGDLPGWEVVGVWEVILKQREKRRSFVSHIIQGPKLPEDGVRTCSIGCPTSACGDTDSGGHGHLTNFSGFGKLSDGRERNGRHSHNTTKKRTKGSLVARSKHKSPFVKGKVQKGRP